MNEEQKFCVKCSHLLGNRSYPESWSTWRCSKTKVIDGTNLVTGEIVSRTAFCSNVRDDPNRCSKEGKWYEEYKKPEGLYDKENIPPLIPRTKVIRTRVTEDDLANL